MQERFGIVGQSAGVRQALDRVRQVAGTEITVLVQGESGGGKELFAQA
ncbi:MAG: sigma 54-interacting transcriptional regulator, partial [Bacteroidetes bacterium]|nr:sigma 54-interacting transcriptional regulator [Bacteroidota bacterium]